MYSCQLCSKSYYWPHDLKRHIQAKHIQQQQHVQQQQQQAQPLTFKHPFTMTVSGPTSCGKTTWLKQVLQHGAITPAPFQIIWCYREWQPLYSEMLQQIPNIRFVEGISIPEVDIQFPHLIVLDDLMTEATKNKEISNMFTVGSHHRNMSIVCLLQNAFYQGKENRTMSLNSHYLVLFKNPRDQLQVSYLARQMYPHNTGYFMEKFLKATSQPYGCLVVDLKQDTPDSERLRCGNVIGQPAIKHASGMKVPVASTSTETIKDYDVNTSVVKSQEEPLVSMCIKDDSLLDKDHLLIESPAVNIIGNNREDTMHSCRYCGNYFQTPYFLHMHNQLGCNMMCVEDSDDDVAPYAWNQLLKKAYRKHDDLYAKKIETLKEEEDEVKADSQVSHELRPKYCRSLMQVYKKFLHQMHELSTNIQHNEIMNMVNWYLMYKGYDFNKAVDITLRKKRHLFEDILDEDQEKTEAAAAATDDDDDTTDDDDDDDDDTEENDEDDDTDETAEESDDA